MLEVGCGDSSHSLMIANSFLKPQGDVLVSSDYSASVMKKFKLDLETSDYSQVPGNEYVVNERLVKSAYLDEVIAKQGDFKKLIYACRANNELLPFKDESFTAYLASLSLMIVDNPRKQLEETYRVLKPGSTAVFTIWGKREESLQFTIIEEVFKEYLPAEEVQKITEQKSNFDFYYNFPIKETLEEIGFTKLKLWMQPANVV